ncbi:HNH endonuclease [Hyphobacterium sp. SN044]|uniref:HNH endonuclease n=1 Tax=Hyphobacterium sp. SN044 TaxID=2912575 RepID=UPI001F37BC46|nr:HNH endonuclease [Hyphobacterium sp. SN044]MCF8880538.1 HNH endonuclease [Hyphobacterium sp. SN044]
MPKVVLTQRAESGYDDVPGELYHFPRQYLKAAEEAREDGCLFYEPRRGDGRMAYWAAGRISEIFDDRDRDDHYYARISDFMTFPVAVPFQRADGSFWESKLARDDGLPSRGAMGWSIRRIPDHEFDLVLKAGFAPALGPELDDRFSAQSGFEEEQFDFERPVFEQILQRKVRDRAFALQVRNAYDSRCAITGLRLINGGGRAEIEAAHIKPVEDRGPDSIRNGIALSRTVHWMFDRGLLSVDRDFRLLVATSLIPEGVERLFHPSGYVHVPDTARDQPGDTFLRWHRENRFKG